MDIEKVLEKLRKKNYTAAYFETKEEAAEHLCREITGKTVGFGDSVTLESMNMYQKLSEDPTNDVHSPNYPPEGMEFNDEAKECLTTEVFLTSVNAMTEDGVLVNMDSTGNRVAGSLFGHEKVYFVTGVNKICQDLESAIDRVRNHAAPLNMLRHEYRSPCVKNIKSGDGKAKCFDCSSPDRICNALVVHYRKMKHTEAEVVIIGEEMGL